MISHRVFYSIMLVWFFGWGILLLRYPARSYTLLARGRRPTVNQLKIAKTVGYMGVIFGCLLLVEIVLGILH